MTKLRGNNGLHDALLAKTHLPTPSIGQCLLERYLSLPTQYLVGMRWVTPDLLDVTLATALDAVRHLDARCLHEGVDQLKYGNTVASAEVIVFNLILRLAIDHAAQSTYVRLSQVGYVDIVTDAATVWRVVVVAEDTQLLADAHSGLANVWQEVLRYATWQLANLSRWVCSDRIEVAQDDGIEVDTCVDVVLDDLLGNLLGVAIRRSSRLDRSRFVNRTLVWFAIDGAAGREDKSLEVEVLCSFKHVHERSQVVTIIEQRLLDTLTYGLAGCEVNHTSNRTFLLECLIYGTLVGTIYLIKSRTDACNLLNAVQDGDF